MEVTIKQPLQATPVHYSMPLARNAYNKLMVLPILRPSSQSNNSHGTVSHCRTTKCSNRRNPRTCQSIWTHPDAKIHYRASNMILNVHSDASYLSAPKAQSHAGGCFFLGSIPRDSELIIINGAIYITCTILKLVAASAAKAKLGALFLNAQEDGLSSKNSGTHNRLHLFTLTTNYRWHCQQHNQKTMVPSHGDAVLLVT